MARSTIYRNALVAWTTLHEYRPESVLGAGSFGVTYLGWDTHLEKHVAIKEYLSTELAMRAADGSVLPLTSDAEQGYRWGQERYILEARTLAKFSHPHIVRVSRYFEGNGTGYMVMDCERGEPLAALRKRAPRPDKAVLKRMLGPLLEGLHAVHAAGFLHRDIKPDNIFFRADGSPVLIDFGATRQLTGGATKTLTAVLTPGYAPLEPYFGEGHQGPWSDLYALAGVLYRALTGETPPDAVTRLKGDRIDEVLARARDRYSEAFVAAARWGLAPEEKNRPRNVDEWKPAPPGRGAGPRRAVRADGDRTPARVRVTAPTKAAGEKPAPSRPERVEARRPGPQRLCARWPLYSSPPLPSATGTTSTRQRRRMRGVRKLPPRPRRRRSSPRQRLRRNPPQPRKQPEHKSSLRRKTRRARQKSRKPNSRAH